MNEFEKDKDIYKTEAVYDPETGELFYQKTWLNGKLHAPPDGSPSYIGGSLEKRLTFTWHAHDKEHRIKGPSKIIMHPNSNIPMTEVFMIEGKPRPADQGPFRIRRDENGDVWQEEFTPSGEMDDLLTQEPS